MSIEDITIVITSFKSNNKINSCLESINEKTKVIIIENSGSEKFKETVEKKYKNVECIVSKENLGYARGNNLGLRRTNTKYALVLNPDTILQTNALENFLSTVSKYKDFSLIGPSSDEKKESNKIEDLINLFDIPHESNALAQVMGVNSGNYGNYRHVMMRPETYIGVHYCARFDDRIQTMIDHPDQYLYDSCSKWDEAHKVSMEVTPKAFKCFQRKGIHFSWPRKGINVLPFDPSNEGWDEEGF